ncbi:periplasmic heavy metal sensor [Marinilabilia sp.]|uniref:Spy/CpxP family protein refolding chaperone n=1 Tax=Marinilabilia sp. TaxID=2021252 RepID=UPI0025BAEBD5|nr:periplasmic heavy metal sensor [Marinilabilia sp.]
MSKNRIIITILILAVAFVGGWGIYRWWNPVSGSSSVGLSNEPVYRIIPGQTNAGVGAGFNRMVKVLDFSEDQIAIFTGIERKYRQQMELYMAQLDSIDLNILEEVKKANPDRGRLDSLSATAGEIQYALKKATSDHFLEVKNICTPEQKQLFNEVISDIDQYRRGRGPGRGQGPRHNGQRRGWRNSR